MTWPYTSHPSPFAHLFARWFVTLAFSLSPSSFARFPTLRDGTDPLCGGHGASRQDRLAGGRT